MIRQLSNVPRECYVACSGGSDSMAVLDFLRRSDKVKGVLYFDHKTAQSTKFLGVVREYCTRHNLDLVTGALSGEHTSGSLEAFWSEERNNFFNSVDRPVVTGHTLDDAVEWWIFTALRGNPRLMPTRNKNVLRPFLTTTRDTLREWNERQDVSYVYDVTNDDRRFTRNFIRHEMLAHCLRVNPGLYKTLAKKISKREKCI
jgi:tRNA(Ile)-lysidine synthetase-like protein